MSEDGVAHAIAIAASLASGLVGNFGSMTKAMHAGLAARNGLMAVQLASRGFTGNLNVFEQANGFLDAYLIRPEFDRRAALEDWGRPFEAESQELRSKIYPCCGATHPAIDAALDLRRRFALSPERISKILVALPQRILDNLNRPCPTSPEAARFSLQYTVACALLHGRVQLKHFEDRALVDAAITAMMAKVELRPRDVAPSKSPFDTSVLVTDVDGRVVSLDSTDLSDDTEVQTLDSDSLWTKFADCADGVLQPAKIQAAFDSLQRLDTADPLELMRILTPDATRA